MITIDCSRASLAEWPKKLDTKQIYRKFGSPAWIVDEKQLCANVEQYAAFTDDPGRIFYPVKTNPSLTVLELLAKMGTGADCASQLEINLALFAGISIRNISYNAPAQDLRICQSLLTSGANVVMDDVEAIVELQNVLKNVAITGKLFLRVNLPDYIGYANKNDNQELMAHGHKSSKFGIPSEELKDMLKRITIPVSGLHVHVGTQMDNMKSFEYAISCLNDIADDLNETGLSITDINIGGGLGIPFDSNQEFPSLEHWSSSMKALQKADYRYGVEPGHALVGNAVALLTSVLTVKNSRGKKWAIADVGTDQLAKVTLLKWPHRILNESGEELQPGSDAVAGPLCFAGDTLAENIDASPLKKGSPLLITEAGAYTFSLSNKFNGRVAPKWLLHKPNGVLIQTMENESVYDESHHAKYDWNISGKSVQTQMLGKDIAERLSSQYLKQTSMDDSFEYQNICIENDKAYKFMVVTSSVVDFISMPFAIRIMGDATIISILHSKGFDKKDSQVWGRKLSMDCLGKVASNGPLEFTVSLSETIIKGNKNIVIARFKTSCNHCSGSLIVSYED